MTAVGVRDVSFKSGESSILERISVEIPAGQITAVVGPNGAGKTTLLRLMAGLEIPTTGEVIIDGDVTTSLSYAQLAKRRSYMSTNLPTDVPFTVRDVVRMGQHPWSQPNETIVDRAIASMDLRILTQRPLHSLSTGEARRTQIARILAHSAPLMILDEPTSGLDVAHTEMVLGALRDSASKGKAVIAVLHDLNVAVRVADHIVVMAGGTIRAAGRPDAVLTEDLLSETFKHPLRVVTGPHRRSIMILPAET